MNLLRRIDKKWWLGSLIIPIIVALIFSVYYERTPNISLVVVSSTNVLDIHEPVKDLSILFQGEDIQKEGTNLRIFKIKMINDGRVDILQGQYDINEKWGIRVDNGEIIDVRLVESNSQYVESNLNPRLSADGLIEFQQIILDRRDYFILEILVLHEKEEMPTIIPEGKIAGIKEIKVSEMVAGSENTNFVKEVFSGSPLVQATRSFLYFLLFLGIAGLLLLLTFVLSGLNDARRKISRKNEFRGFLKELGDPVRSHYPKHLEVLSAIYEIAGSDSLEKTKYFIENISMITAWRAYHVEMHRKQARTVEELARQKSLDDGDEAYRPFARKELLMENAIIVQLIRNDIVSEAKDKNVIVDNEFKGLLDRFIEYSRK